MNISGAGLGLACLHFFASLAALAAEPLTLGRAIERAVSANPSLAARAADDEAAAARAMRESFAPPLTIGAELENFSGTGALRGADSAEMTLRVGRLIELGGKRAARRALGDAELARSHAARAVTRNDVVNSTTARVVEAAADQARLALAEEQLALTKAMRDQVAQAVESARSPDADLHAAEISVADAELAREHAEHELASARMTLASTWGATDAEFGEIVMRLTELPEIEGLATLVEQLRTSALLRSADLDNQSLGARRRVAESSRKPDIALSLGVRRLEAFADHGLVASVSVPLGTGERGRLAVDEARAQLSAGEHRRRALFAELHQQLFEKYQELSHARTEMRAIADTMLPTARLALASAQRGFRLGRFPFVTLSQAQRTLFDLRRREIDTAARFHSLLADLGYLVTGTESP